jgi:hypothetical protein
MVRKMLAAVREQPRDDVVAAASCDRCDLERR